mgnify:CR=1 FL=1
MGFLFQLDLKEASEFTGKINGNSSVHSPLFVEEALFPLDRENAFMPDVGMDIKPLVSVAAKADEILGLDVISWKG